MYFMRFSQTTWFIKPSVFFIRDILIRMFQGNSNSRKVSMIKPIMPQRASVRFIYFNNDITKIKLTILLTVEEQL